MVEYAILVLEFYTSKIRPKYEYFGLTIHLSYMHFWRVNRLSLCHRLCSWQNTWPVRKRIDVSRLKLRQTLYDISMLNEETRRQALENAAADCSNVSVDPQPERGALFRNKKHMSGQHCSSFNPYFRSTFHSNSFVCQVSWPVVCSRSAQCEHYASLFKSEAENEGLMVTW